MIHNSKVIEDEDNFENDDILVRTLSRMSKGNSEQLNFGFELRRDLENGKSGNLTKDLKSVKIIEKDLLWISLE
jgi:hypothetical protein